MYGNGVATGMILILIENAEILQVHAKALSECFVAAVITVAPEAVAFHSAPAVRQSVAFTAQDYVLPYKTNA